MAIFLNSGLLKSPTCTVGDYRVDWKKGSRSGDVIFISGKGNDPEIQEQHPIINEIVASGDLYPVIKYVFINGDKVTSEYEIGVLFSPDLVDCLPFTTIDEINCSTLYNEDNLYDIRLLYNNTQSNIINKNKVFSFYISPTTQFLAWYMKAYTIAEGIKFYYCTNINPSGILVDNYIVGSQRSNGVPIVNDLTPLDYPNNPKICNTRYKYPQGFKHLVDLTPFTYASGDYVKVEIIGSVFDPTNNNTNWEVGLKCLDSFDTSFPGIEDSDIELTTPPELEYRTLNCQYFLNYKTKESGQGVIQPASCDILNYLSVTTFRRQKIAKDIDTTISFDGFDIEQFFLYTIRAQYSTNSTGQCRNVSGDIVFEKIGNTLKVTLPSQAEYDRYVGDIVDVQASSYYTNYLASNPTEIAYYSSWRVEGIISTSCGDSSTTLREAIHLSSIITYDNVNYTITFSLPTIANGFPFGETCFSPYPNIVTQLQQMDSTVNKADYSITTNVSRTLYLSIASPSIYNSTFIDDTVALYYQIPELVYDNLLPSVIMGANFFCQNAEGNWDRYRSYDKLTFTDPSTSQTRLENWTLERQKRMRTGLCTDIISEENWELVYTKTS